MLAEALRFEGHDVVEAFDVADALEQLRRGVRPDLIFLDLVMPRMDGRQFLAEVHDDRELADLPVVLLTGTPPSDLSGAVSAILKKPVGIDDLLDCVRRCAAGSTRKPNRGS